MLPVRGTYQRQQAIYRLLETFLVRHLTKLLKQWDAFDGGKETMPIASLLEKVRFRLTVLNAHLAPCPCETHETKPFRLYEFEQVFHDFLFKQVVLARH